MRVKQSVVAAIVLSGVVGLVTSTWSQEAPGERRQSDPNLTRPGQQDVPGINQKGTAELSKNDMRAVEEALQTKGYKPGKIDGVADDETRAAIRAFQKANGFPVSGMVDQKTADRLGVKISSKSGGTQRSIRLVECPEKTERDLKPSPAMIRASLLGHESNIT